MTVQRHNPAYRLAFFSRKKEKPHRITHSVRFFILIDDTSPRSTDSGKQRFPGLSIQTHAPTVVPLM